MSLLRMLPMFGLSIVIAALISSSPVGAQEPSSAPWTSVGSAGTVDETDLPNVDLGSPGAGAVSIAGYLPRPVVHIRYNVVAVAGVLGGTGLTLTSRYMHGDYRFFRGQVIVRLMQYNLHTGFLHPLLTLDSDDFEETGGFQMQSVATSCSKPFVALDFVNNSYFVEVSLSRMSKVALVGGPTWNRAALAMITLASNVECIN